MTSPNDSRMGLQLLYEGIVDDVHAVELARLLEVRLTSLQR